MAEASTPTQTLLDRMIVERQLSAADAAAFVQARSLPGTGGKGGQEPNEREVLEWLSQEYGVGFLPLESVEADREVLALFPARILLKEELLPLRRDLGRLDVDTCVLLSIRVI
jgi:general secretion pathway protein E/type IV pilus assembly protein PilB